jgi:hypothetical protein
VARQARACGGRKSAFLSSATVQNFFPGYM